ncbi:putative LRR receptor-like serine/threonine-protein kinase [Cinnamomum micranthum f. kanehirae]|uniref:non-specific serine/threonine protein kinase n=1 Tax=Cinnamomum micranthum f. kanehirae TaxID=337451 RepID=A0A3S4NMC4_9MAGN|nr:putative LRR receptor-like serine/threonine-protein kinase [Cinnamomum micranthum f. kanehirae]
MVGASVCIWVAILVSWSCYSAPPVGAQKTYPSEVTTLRVIKESLIDPNNNLSNWGKGDPCKSNWTGVICRVTPGDAYLHVEELHLFNMNLSGPLPPVLDQLSHLTILNFMWNKMSGHIPKEIGNMTALKLLLLNGNQFSGSLPDELGNLPNLRRLQIDENQISGPLPKSLAKLSELQHLHMNNNSISGQLPSELSKLPKLIHFLLDNNNLSGPLPPEYSELPGLLILQLDNNNFSGNKIPDSYGNMSKLLKLSLRNCSLQGAIPDLSRIPHLIYLDLSWNRLTGSMPSNKLSDHITTIELSHNNFTGSIPANFAVLPHLQKLSLENNSLNGSVPSTIWQNVIFSENQSLILDFQNNLLSSVSGNLNPPSNVTLKLQGNPVCKNENLFQFCGSQNGGDGSGTPGNSTKSIKDCPQSCPTDAYYEYDLESPELCFCAAPIRVGYRLKSPSFSDFYPYRSSFKMFLTSELKLNLSQLSIDSFIWESGPRLRMYLKFFPLYDNHSGTIAHQFNTSEIVRIKNIFTDWSIVANDTFGPAELLNFTLLGPYLNVLPLPNKGINKGTFAGIVLGAVAIAVMVTAFISFLIMRRKTTEGYAPSRAPIKIDGVKDFTFGDMISATSNFSTLVGRGGYGSVYKGILADGTVVAIKRAQEGSLQGEKEFLTEIELLSRLHHRNLVSLLGYCDEEDEQMLVYEFMPNGTLRDWISAKAKESLNFSMRLRIALGSARGIFYLHTEADPPIFHRDIKASNILLDHKFTAKVADFGLSRLAPLPDTEGSMPDHVSTVVKGTPGYLDPEYFLTHKLTDKSDVYSLGVVFLELLTGMHAISHGKNIVREVNLAYQSGMVFSVIDKRMGSYPSECVELFISLALRCCKDETEKRPSMAEVVRELENIWRMMPESDSAVSGSLPTPSGRQMMTPSSPSSSSKPFLSSDISNSDLVSGEIPRIRPR